MTAAGYRIVLPSGLEFDFTNMFGAERLQQTDIAALEAKITEAAKALEHMRATGEAPGHLSKDGNLEHVYFPRLPYVREGYPNTPELLQELELCGKDIRENCDVVVFCGIGGSYLGGKVLYDCFSSRLWEGAKPQGRLSKIYFSGNSLDVEDMESIWLEMQEAAQKLLASGRKLQVAVVPISKSGTTLESTAAFLYFYNQVKSNGAEFDLKVAVVTDKHNAKAPLNILAQENNWPMFDVVEGIGGRFSVLSTPGLIVAAILGIDMQELLAGAAAMDKACVSPVLGENPALANAVYKYLAGAKYGCNIEVMMPYSFKLASLGNWYVQLLAESLGKRKDKQGKTVFYGRTPTAAIGTTDMHSQTQLHQEGRRDKIIQFIALGGAMEKIKLSNPFPQIEAFSKFEGLDVNKALLVALHANAEALTSDNRFNACYNLPQLNAYFLGQIFYYLMLTVAYEGELANVDAYDQPGVEVYKRIMNRNL